MTSSTGPPDNSRVSVVSRYHQITRWVTETLSVGLFVTVLVLQLINIFLRYTKVAPPAMWVEDFSKYALIWIFFLLWHLADRRNEHFAVDFLRQKCSSATGRVLVLLGHVVAMAFALVVVGSAVAFIPSLLGYPTQSFSWLPMGMVYVVIPIGLILVFVERLLLFWRDWSR